MPLCQDKLAISGYQTIFQLAAGVNILLAVFEQLVSPHSSAITHSFTVIGDKATHLRSIVDGDDVIFWYEKTDCPPARKDIQKDIRRAISGVGLALHRLRLEFSRTGDIIVATSIVISATSFCAFLLSLAILFYTAIEAQKFECNSVIMWINYEPVWLDEILAASSVVVFFPLLLSFYMYFSFRLTHFRRFYGRLKEVERSLKRVESEIFGFKSDANKLRRPRMPPTHIKSLILEPHPGGRVPASALDASIERERYIKEAWRDHWQL